MYFLFYNSKKYSFILLKSTKFNRSKVQNVLELFSKTVDYLWKTATNLNLNISQEHFNEWSLSGDIRNLDDVIIILISEKNCTETQG